MYNQLVDIGHCSSLRFITQRYTYLVHGAYMYTLIYVCMFGFIMIIYSDYMSVSMNNQRVYVYSM